jgi:hypothetical protein
MRTKTSYSGRKKRIERDKRRREQRGVQNTRRKQDDEGRAKLDTETVECSSLSLESVDDVERGDGLALGVLGVGDRVSDDVCTMTRRRESAAGQVKGEREGGGEEREGREGKLTLKEDLQDPSSLFVDETRDTLDTSSSSETSDGGFGDALAVKREEGRERERRGRRVS